MPRYQVNVKAPAEDRTAFIKALHVAGLGKAAAEHIAETLVASGASVIVLESPLDTPMMCCPEADE
jgi:hypothetical protein